jgi:hypothetical protein
MASQSSLLKEIYEKKGKKMAATPPTNGRPMPPFMKGRKNAAEDRNREMGSAAAKRRLAKMSGKKIEGK